MRWWWDSIWGGKGVVVEVEGSGRGCGGCRWSVWGKMVRSRTAFRTPNCVTMHFFSSVMFSGVEGWLWQTPNAAHSSTWCPGAGLEQVASKADKYWGGFIPLNLRMREDPRLRTVPATWRPVPTWEARVRAEPTGPPRLPAPKAMMGARADPVWIRLPGRALEMARLIPAMPGVTWWKARAVLLTGGMVEGRWQTSRWRRRTVERAWWSAGSWWSLCRCRGWRGRKSWRAAEKQ